MKDKKLEADLEIQICEAVNVDGVIIVQTMLGEENKALIPRQSIPEVIAALQIFYDTEKQ